MSRTKNYRCDCDAEFDNLKQAVAHCRKEHPDDGGGCLDQFGTVGDKFADSAIRHETERWQKAENELREAKSKIAAYDGSYARVCGLYNEMQRRVQIVQLAMTWPQEMKADPIGDGK